MVDFIFKIKLLNNHFTLIEQSATETEEQSSETESVERLVVIE